MDEDKVLAKLQELKDREEAKKLAEAQAKAEADSRRKQEAEERAIEQEALRRYEESKVNAYIEANDIEGLMDYITLLSKSKKNWFRVYLDYYHKNNWVWNKQTFIEKYNIYIIPNNAYTGWQNPPPNYYLLSEETKQKIYDTIMAYFDSKIKEDDDYEKETLRLKQIKIDYDAEQRQIKYYEQMKEDFEYFMDNKTGLTFTDEARCRYNTPAYRLLSYLQGNESNNFEKLFWNYITNLGCFDKCPSCSNKPKVIKRIEYECYVQGYSSGSHMENYFHMVEGFLNIQRFSTNTGWDTKNYFMGAIKYVACCEHLFNLDDNKRYIQADKVKLITGPIIKLAVSGTKVVKYGKVEEYRTKLTEQDYILYDPEDPYKIKAKREKDIAETTQEIETLRAKLVDAIERLNLLRTEGSGEA